MTTLRLADRLSRIKPSVTMAVTARAAELRAQGIDVISFGAGEPDFETPAYIIDGLREALEKGVSKYTNVRGTVALRAAVARELGKAHGFDVDPAQVIVSCGAKHSLYNACMAMFQEGDEVLIPAPYWVSYPAMVKLSGADPVIVASSADEGFLLRPEDLDAAVTDRTRAIIFNNPCNPTGAVYPRDRLAAVAEVISARGLFLISDDIYRSLIYGDRAYWSMARVAPDLVERTLFVDGVSKSYAMTGWRIGYATGPAELIGAMSKIQSQSTSGASHAAQAAALTALTGPQDALGVMRETFDRRRRRMVELLRAIDGVTCPEPGGAFYCFPDASAYIGRRGPEGQTIGDDVALASYLVDHGKVAVVPGSAFGAPGCLRLSYACSMEDIENGVGRLGEALGRLS